MTLAFIFWGVFFFIIGWIMRGKYDDSNSGPFMNIGDNEIN
jgi:hypothetical protein